MKPYKQKDLGYQRALTSAAMRVTFSNGECYDVPLQIIADNRDEYYRREKEDTVQYFRDGGLDKYDFTDWFVNNMNWSEVSDYAIRVAREQKPFDYESDIGRGNCEKKIEGGV